MKRERVKTGVEGLDEILAGGFLPGSINLVKGAPGTGKTTLGLEFIARGIDQFSEPGLIVTFEQFPEQLQRDALSYGIDLAKLENEGSLRLIFTSPQTFVEEIVKPGGIFDSIMVEVGVKRILVDSISHLERLGETGAALREAVYLFTNGLKRYDATVLLTQEDLTIIGDLHSRDYGLSYMVDSVIQMRYVELDSAVAKALFVLKQRASNHDKSIKQYKITDKGLSIEAPFINRQGVLSGQAALVADQAFIKAFGGRKST